MLARLSQKHDRGEMPLTIMATVESKHGAPFTVIHKHILRILLFLLIGSFFLPAHPWRHMSSTLLFDVIGTILSTILSNHLRNMAPKSSTNSHSATNPLGNLNYNPADDPYYISNLDSPIDSFIAEALEGVEITNIVHIVLESMRADSYPFKENGLLAQYIERTFEKPDDAVPITTANISPFIASLAESTLSWETMWATIPFTHKAMLGRTSPNEITNSQTIADNSRYQSIGAWSSNHQQSYINIVCHKSSGT